MEDYNIEDLQSISEIQSALESLPFSFYPEEPCTISSVDVLPGATVNIK